MKKMGKIVIALMTVLTLGLTIAGCSCSADNSKSNTTGNNAANNTVTENIARTEDTLSNSIIGSWRHEKGSESDTTHIYTFNADGTGKIKVIVDKEYVWDFTYKATNDTISRTMDNETIDFKYSIEGNNMDVTNTDGTIIHYTKE